MRLKCIKLAGFKSFVDPTTVNFPSNLGAVVGPNGCGKSNIIDAVRWVMGESSAKNLRGEAMTDVIFNGSNTRKPIGQASIELVFDNSDGKIVGEYASFSEISIKRKVTRDGQNLYYLNGSKCRRRDITDIFLGTGLGPRSYAIIEQGMISRLIEAKPEELRVYIEEAAGISKYKERRRDTENRMRRTHENLERLTDIREELERQLSRLERQAQSAEKYREYKAVERDLKAKLQALKFRSLKDQAVSKHSKIRELELQVEAAVTEQVHHDSNIEIHRTKFAEFGDSFNEVQARFYAVGTDIAKIEQTITHSQERERQLRMDLEQTIRDCKEAEEHLSTDAAKAEGWQAELLEIEPEMEMLSEVEEGSSDALQTAEEGMQEWQLEWDAFNQKASTPRQEAEVQQSRIQYLEQVQQRLLDRIKKHEAEKGRLVVGESESEILLLEEQLAEYELKLEEATTSSEQASGSLTQLRAQESELSQSQNQIRGDLQTNKGRQASLEALQQAALGQSDQHISSWLESVGLDSAKRVAEQVSVDPGWEKAVEAVLGHSLQAVCVDTALEQLSSAVGSVDKGEVTLFSTVGHCESSGTQPESLLAKTHSALDLSPWLGNVYASETLTAALQRQKSLLPHETIVTKEGLWLGCNWLRVAKDKDANSGVIARKQELESLSALIHSQQGQLDTLESDFLSCKDAVIGAEQQREQARAEMDSLVRQQANTRTQLSSLTAKVEQVLEGRKRADLEIGEAKEQLDLEGENLSESRLKLQDAIEAMEQDTQERERLLSKRDTIRESLDSARQKARHDKDRAHELAMRLQSVKTQLSAVNQGIARLKEQTMRLQERHDTIEETLQNSLEPVETYKDELEANLDKRIKIEEELIAARKAVEEVEAALRQSEQKRHSVEQSLQQVRTDLEKERMDAKSLDVQAEGVKEQLIEEEFDIDAVLADLEEDLNINSLSQELETIATRISRLGAINLAAIDEYKIESERKNYLDAQNADLEEALETLENAIRKIDKETRTRFKETFDQVNGGIQELFPKVFGGGHAYLELTGEDLLDTGIAIMARPPGKKNSTIHLLSGGEKALTAIALVFSIFRLNPAPFCMLDEVDAPLDDANVGRYARMVEEMSSQVQFIYITHNKIAMEMAHQLLGVTMHEPGVSRIVTVDVEEAAELAAV